MMSAEHDAVASEIATLLEQLQALYTEKDQAQLAHEAARIGLMSQALQRRLAALDTAFVTAQAAQEAHITQLEQAVKTATLAYGKSVACPTLHAVYNPGRVTWDARALAGYAIDHSELLQFCKTGDPYITIRTKQKGT